MSVLHAPIDWPVEIYQQFSDLDEGGIWQPPINPAVANSQAPLIFQLVHSRPMLNGHALWVDRVRRPEWDDFVQSNPLLRAMHQFERAEHSKELVLEKADIDALLSVGVRYLVIDQELFPTRLSPILRGYREIGRKLFGKPVLENSGVWVWDLKRWNGTRRVSMLGWEWPSDVLPGENGRRLRIRNHRSKVLRENSR